MMKKLLSIVAIGLLGTTAFGQQKMDNSIVMKPFSNQTATPEATRLNAEKMMRDRAERLAERAAHKGTLSGTRLHNYLDYLVATNNSPSSTLPYMWFTHNALGIYQKTSGIDTSIINQVSYGTVLMPWFSGFSDPNVPGAAGKIYIANYNNYQVDSVYFYGVYGRNSAKLSVVDTMRAALVYGDNIRSFTYSGTDYKQNFGHDTVRVATVRYDDITKTADSFSTGNAPAVIKNMPMNSATALDTTASGLEIVRFAFNTPIPGGAMIAVTGTFKTGDASFIPYDTVFRGSTNPAEPFKYNMWRPAIYGQNANAYPTYTPGNWNGGLTKTYPDTSNGYGGWYIPYIAWIGASSDNEFPDIDIILSCTNCAQVSVAEAQQNIVNYGIYPNPARTEASISFGLSIPSDVNISIYNSVGQVIEKQTMKNVSGGTAKFNIANLPAGVYIYTLEANGMNRSGRFTVSY